MIKEYNGHKPHIHNSCFIAENTTIIGRVTIKRNASIWYGTVIRGDDNYISIGENTNVQDNCTIHIAEDYPTIIGDNVTIGHGAIVHGCKVGNNVLIGMGAIILDGAEIEDNVLIAAGSLVSPGKKMPSNTLVMGSPAKVVRELTKEEIVNIKNSADYYVKLAEEHKKIGL